MVDSPTVLGIDLGTTNAVMAILNSSGQPELLPNSDGHPITPSAVYFYEKDACVVGAEAMKMCISEPSEVIRMVKRQMGLSSGAIATRGGQFSPQEISAFILRKLKEDAERVLGKSIEEAVIAVPVYFNSAQREATVQAGEIAGLRVLSLVNEPTAAALHHAIDKLGDTHTQLIVDLGGGTFDATIMKIQDARLMTLATDGVADLGGYEWDVRLVNHAASRFIDHCGLDPRSDTLAHQDLYERCVAAKVHLSSKQRVVIPMQFHGEHLNLEVTRAFFEILTKDLVDRCIEAITRTLNDGALSWNQVDDIVLTGGATRMPMISKAVERLSGKPTSGATHPELSVSYGAAIAGLLRHYPNHPHLHVTPSQDPSPATEAEADLPTKPPSPPMPHPSSAVVGLASGGHVASDAEEELRTENISLEERSTLTLGILFMDKLRQERVLELIPRGTILPCLVKKRFAYAFDNMESLTITITEGCGEDRTSVRIIGQLELSDLPPRPRGTPVEIQYTYDLGQRLSVSMEDTQTGKLTRAQLRLSGLLDPAQVEEIRAAQDDFRVD